jgi:hypothetical protein
MFVILLLILIGALPAWSQCTPTIPMDEFIYKFGLFDEVHTHADLLALLENPTVITAEAVPAGPDVEASTIATTEIHVLYPIEASAMVETLNDAESLTSFMPNLAVHETICRIGPNMVKQFQRTEFNVLFLTFGTEYLIDVYYALNGPEEYGSYWGMYESVDDKLAYQYGSWYFKNITIDNRQYTYVRHFSTNGVKTRVPGLRMMIERSAGERVGNVIDALYHEAASRYGTSPVASAP